MTGSDPDTVLGSEFCWRPAEEVARDLLGMRLVSLVDGKRAAGRIVEVEAYVGPHDPASHAAERIGRTERNGAMFGAPGTAYVYRIYGLHWCLNVVTDEPGFPAAVLIRGVDPLDGLPVMRARRAGRRVPPDSGIARGPGNVAAAFGVTGGLDGHALDHPPLRLLRGSPVPDREVERGPRVGVTRAVEWPLRFWVRGNPAVSRR